MKPLFLCHGSPMLAIQDDAYTRFLQQLGNPRPSGIAVFTAHWESPVLSVTERDDEYETIYDFYGFPEELYRVRYPARGSVELARRLQGLFTAAGIPVRGERERGLDHGVWVLLRHLCPAADVPVVAVSVNPALPPAAQYRIGRALSPLRKENVLVVGSGATCHNLYLVDWEATTPADWAVAFDDWLLDKVMKWDLDALFAYETQAPFARLAVPRNEHLVPLFLAMGAADDQRQANLLYRAYEFGTLSMIGIQFG